MAPKHQAPRGTRDLLPDEAAQWRFVEAQARGVLERYGYGEIRTPMFEEYELFARTSGESSDLVQKEMYRFKDLGDYAKDTTSLTMGTGLATLLDAVFPMPSCPTLFLPRHHTVRSSLSAQIKPDPM